MFGDVYRPKDGAVAPHGGAWIEMRTVSTGADLRTVAPHGGAWIEIAQSPLEPICAPVAPHGGAWIEMRSTRACGAAKCWSPLTEGRGLKLAEYLRRAADDLVAPHGGAWIEMPGMPCSPRSPVVAPHGGTWIEISLLR